MCPVNDLEQALPVAPVLDPQLLLRTVPKFAITAGTPERINHPQVLLWNELHLHRTHITSIILMTMQG